MRDLKITVILFVLGTFCATYVTNRSITSPSVPNITSPDANTVTNPVVTPEVKQGTSKKGCRKLKSKCKENKLDTNPDCQKWEQKCKKNVTTPPVTNISVTKPSVIDVTTPDVTTVTNPTITPIIKQREGPSKKECRKLKRKCKKNKQFDLNVNNVTTPGVTTVTHPDVNPVTPTIMNLTRNPACTEWKSKCKKKKQKKMKPSSTNVTNPNVSNITTPDVNTVTNPAVTSTVKQRQGPSKERCQELKNKCQENQMLDPNPDCKIWEKKCKEQNVTTPGSTSPEVTTPGVLKPSVIDVTNPVRTPTLSPTVKQRQGHSKKKCQKLKSKCNENQMLDPNPDCQIWEKKCKEHVTTLGVTNPSVTPTETQREVTPNPECPNGKRKCKKQNVTSPGVTTPSVTKPIVTNITTPGVNTVSNPTLTPTVKQRHGPSKERCQQLKNKCQENQMLDPNPDCKLWEQKCKPNATTLGVTNPSVTPTETQREVTPNPECPYGKRKCKKQNVTTPSVTKPSVTDVTTPGVNTVMNPTVTPTVTQRPSKEKCQKLKSHCKENQMLDPNPDCKIWEQKCKPNVTTLGVTNPSVTPTVTECPNGKRKCKKQNVTNPGSIIPGVTTTVVPTSGVINVTNPYVTSIPVCTAKLNCKEKNLFDVQLLDKNLGQNAGVSLYYCSESLKMVDSYANKYLITPGAQQKFKSFRIEKLCFGTLNVRVIATRYEDVEESSDQNRITRTSFIHVEKPDKGRWVETCFELADRSVAWVSLTSTPVTGKEFDMYLRGVYMNACLP